MSSNSLSNHTISKHYPKKKKVKIDHEETPNYNTFQSIDIEDCDYSNKQSCLKSNTTNIGNGCMNNFNNSQYNTLNK